MWINFLLQSDEDLFGESKAKADTQSNVIEEEEDEEEKALKDDKANTAKVKATAVKFISDVISV